MSYCKFCETMNYVQFLQVKTLISLTKRKKDEKIYRCSLNLFILSNLKSYTFSEILFKASFYHLES